MLGRTVHDGAYENAAWWLFLPARAHVPTFGSSLVLFQSLLNTR